ncbi:hypothetical protein FOL47_002069 [Perkinsus chesapeaki]|uniref:Uncharacterized protein n=1 Tax=Perkinsus chesapeaki TaxID=330153 RepID=A0A7J6MFI5_PERCH|nr:hypothetical protein FOL47_002069 [Perkinsus chesapeaki]
MRLTSLTVIIYHACFVVWGSGNNKPNRNKPNPDNEHPDLEPFPYQAPIHPHQSCDRGYRVRVIYGNKAAGSICTVFCRETSDCPPPKEGDAKPVCRNRQCCLDCAEGARSCPEGLGCRVLESPSFCLDPLSVD